MNYPPYNTPNLALNQVKPKSLTSSYGSRLDDTVLVNEQAQVAVENPPLIPTRNGYSPVEIIIATSVLITAVAGLIKVLVPVVKKR